MQALVLNDDREAQVATAMALFKRNFQVVTAETVDHAAAYADLGVFDLVVMGERVQGRLSHSVALSAELRNPDVTTMVLTPRADADVDELFELLPSLYCLLGDELDPELVAKMAVAGVVGSLSVADRARPAVEEMAEDVAEATDAVAETAEGAALPGGETPDEAGTSVMADIMARATASLERDGACDKAGTDERSREIVAA